MSASARGTHYAVAVRRSFVAHHYLVGGDWGAENERHSHNYRVEVELVGPELDEHGYLVDIVEIEERLDSLVERYRDRTLNDLPEFAGLNPSIEHFARLWCDKMIEGLDHPTIRAVTVRIWEAEIAWASFRRELR